MNEAISQICEMVLNIEMMAQLEQSKSLKNKELLWKVAERLSAALAGVPFLTLAHPPRPQRRSVEGQYFEDLVAEVDADGRKWTLLCGVRSDAQPRQVRSAVVELRERARRVRHAYPILIAPYLSPESIAICQEAGVGALDFSGNVRLIFGRTYVERVGPRHPPRHIGESRNPFASKSARVLRVLLSDPAVSWKVTALSEATGISLGQISYVRRALLDREWAAEAKDGIRVVKPRELLNAWRAEYKRVRRPTNKYYTLLHGRDLERAIAQVLEKFGKDGHAVLASFSAARWIAPYARIATNFFYADSDGELALIKGLKLESSARGENVVIYRPRDVGLLMDRHELASGIWCTGAVQTYLDMAVSGERGEEAAEHLFRSKIEPQWKKRE